MNPSSRQTPSFGCGFDVVVDVVDVDELDVVDGSVEDVVDDGVVFSEVVSSVELVGVSDDVVDPDDAVVSDLPAHPVLSAKSHVSKSWLHAVPSAQSKSYLL